MALHQVSLEAQNISLAYGNTPVLKDIILRIEPGEFFALLGPSGSGKSTLLRLIAGFNQHQSGHLLIDGKDITGIPAHARNVGMVFQNYALWPHMTVWDNVAFGLVERKVSKDDIKRRVSQALDLVGLGAYAKRHPGQLSGGQQQRVALARTVVIEPKLLLLDEPLSNLDKNLRVQMRDELKNLQRQLGLTTVFVTHDQEEAMTTADRMAVLDKGVLQQIGTAQELFDIPANRFVASFVGTANILPVKDLAWDRLFPDQSHAVFRPHTVRLSARADAAASAGVSGWLSLHGQVQESEFLGETIRYKVRVGDHLIQANEARQIGHDALPLGTLVDLWIDPHNVRALTN